MTTRKVAFMLLASGLIFAACSKSKLKKYRTGTINGDGRGIAGDGSIVGEDGDDGKNTPEYLSLHPETLVWKRYRAFESGLMDGLQLPKADVCVEGGQFSCIETVHLTVLGGNEPYQNAQYERAATPTALTPIAVERVILSACGKRLGLDKGLGASAVVFKHFALSGAMPGPEQIKKQTAELFQRLLARDATEAETGIAQSMTQTMLTPEKLALGLCFVVGSSSENVFL